MSDDQLSPQDIVMARIFDDLSEDDVRISRIMETIESEYVRTPNDDVVESEIRLLVRAVTRKTRDGHVLIFTGESGAGKSTTIHHHLNKYKSLRPSVDQYGDTLVPLIRVKAPSDCTMRDLGLEMLGRMDYEVKRELSEAAVYRYVRERLKILGTKVVFIDEFQHILDAPTIKGVRHLTDQLKNLLQEEGYPIYIIVAGLPEIATVVHRDPKEQMEGRTVVWRFPDLSFEKDKEFLCEVVCHYAALAEMELAVEPTDDFISRMLHAGRHRLGIVMRIVMFAIEDALDRGDKMIANEHWTRSYHRLAKRGRNVFSDDEWWTIKRNVMRDGTLGPEGIEEQPKPSRSRSAKRKA
ncbi:ATP-binding protein [Agrobacterium burrii]|uniref:ATP-binding protein n=1 Tax=Agrobacterium burrii TaxID=2815339 RepID=A0ABS3EJY6_9HYPH|nr:ATP-binding protein [Agrobacterium burrii]MBO0132301.1 ATP-binding protein [Agrobacterium burrii]